MEWKMLHYLRCFSVGQWGTVKFHRQICIDLTSASNRGWGDGPLHPAASAAPVSKHRTVKSTTSFN